MGYAISNLQVCSICQDEDRLINPNIESFNSQGSNTIKKKVKVLKNCGHAFHPECINRFFYTAQKTCPNCRSSISEEDQKFDVFQDPAPPEGFDRYLSSEGDFMNFEKNVPYSIKKNVLENREAFIRGDVPGFITTGDISFSIRSSENGRQHHQAPSFDGRPFYIDQNGVAHPSKENDQS